MSTEKKFEMPKKRVLSYPLNLCTEYIACHAIVEGLSARFSEIRRRGTTREYILLQEFHISDFR